MENETGQIEEVEPESIEQTNTSNQPANLEEALKFLREKDKEPASTNVETGERDETSREGSSNSNEVSDSSIQSEPDGSSGGFVDTSLETNEQFVTQEDYFTPTDYQSLQKNLITSVNQQAIQETKKVFAEQGIRKMTVRDLYERDEENGRVTFVNPEDQNKPFESRQAAQQWCDSYNRDVEEAMVDYANQIRDKYINDTLPAMRLMEFAPTYDKMDEMTQKVFDSIIEPYSVKDSSGALIGFSCDLNAAAQQAAKVLENIKPVIDEGKATAVVVPRTDIPQEPALDMTTSSSDTSTNKVETPKNMNEAMKIINKRKREVNGK